MNEVFLWVAAAWVLAMGLVFALLGMSKKQERAARDEEMAVAVRWLGSVNDDWAEPFSRWERRFLQATPLEAPDIDARWSSGVSVREA